MTRRNAGARVILPARVRIVTHTGIGYAAKVIGLMPKDGHGRDSGSAEMINTLTILGLSLGLASGLFYLKHPGRLGPFRQLQRAATVCRACVICTSLVARSAVGNWKYYWPDAVRAAKEGK